ncbi:MAG: type II toxin-antitoxin system HipA family toxin [Beijerinckiaceae bacterium]
MPRKKRHGPLSIFQNGRRVGTLLKESSGAISFQYAEDWLSAEHSFPVSLSLPLREDAWRGAPVSAVFENLLPDSDAIRSRIAERLGAEGIDAYSLLAMIGRDCVGALQFLPEDMPPPLSGEPISGELLEDSAVEAILNNLSRAPLGLDRDDGFRISVAGAQEKTALLRHNGRWLRPQGATPTTHIFKTRIGRLPGGIDLADSIENEFYCLKLLEAFGLAVAKVEILEFGPTKALAVERFDRAWTPDGRLMRLPQEDMCQALSVPPTRKYESEGGPGVKSVLDLLTGSFTPSRDKSDFLKAQLLFWLMGATDGHAKNFSIRLFPGGAFQMTPLYDVLSAAQAFDAGQIDRKGMRMAMAVGDKRHYRMDEIAFRHFAQTAKGTGVRFRLLVEEIADGAGVALDLAAEQMLADYGGDLPELIGRSVRQRLSGLKPSDFG